MTKNLHRGFHQRYLVSILDGFLKETLQEAESLFVCRSICGKSEETLIPWLSNEKTGFLGDADYRNQTLKDSKWG